MKKEKISVIEKVIRVVKCRLEIVFTFFSKISLKLKLHIQYPRIYRIGKKQDQETSGK